MSGVCVLTYAVMSNHFRLLLAVDHPKSNGAQLLDAGE